MQVAQLIGAADTIYGILSFAQGSAEQALLNREEALSRFVEEDGVIYFPNAKKTAMQAEQQTETTFLQFTPKELSKMPKFFRDVYKLKGGKIAHIRQKPNGSYEIR